MTINRTTLALSIPKVLDAEVRAEAARQRRPLCRVAEELLVAGLKSSALPPTRKDGARVFGKRVAVHAGKRGGKGVA